MKTYKRLNRNAKMNFVKHYVLFVLICFVSAFIFSEYTSSLRFVRLNVSDSIIVDISHEFRLGNIDQVKEQQQLKLKELQSTNARYLGRKRGILSSIVNKLDTGTIYVSLLTGVYSMVGSANITLAILIGISLLLVLLLWMFISNTYKVLVRRIFLEGRIYENIPKEKVLFFKDTKSWTNVALTKFKTFILKSLWALTIVGYVIKRYSYYMIDFILAENPNMKTDDVINLSRDMMNGHKFELFKLELLIFPLEALGFVTFGILNILFVNPLKIAIMTEYYVELRKEAKTKKIKNVKSLNDKYLYEKISEEDAREVYNPILSKIDTPVYSAKKKTGLSKFIKSFFGVCLKETEEIENTEHEEYINKQVKYLENEVSGKTYPTLCNPYMKDKQIKTISSIYYLRKYSLLNIIIMCFSFMIFGWLWEVVFHFVNYGEFVNRGTLYGPWLSIYGFGSIAILIFLYKYRNNPIKHMILTALLCGGIEYVTSYVLEMTHDGLRWWDYTGFFLNINGRVCAEGIFAFVFGGTLVTYYVAPKVDDFLKKINKKILVIIAVVLLTAYMGDQIYSNIHPHTGSGITKNISQIKNVKE